MVTIELSDTIASWFNGLARQHGMPLASVCEDALTYYRMRYKELSLPDPGMISVDGTGGGTLRDDRSEQAKMDAILDLVRRLGDHLEFVGVKYLYTRAMLQARIGVDLGERRNLVSKLIDTGALVAYKTPNNREGGSDVTAVELAELLDEDADSADAADQV